MSEHDLENLSQELHDTFRMLKCAFPNGVEQEDFLPLLFILNESMSFRQEARVVGELIGKSYMDLLNNIYFVASKSYTPESADIERVKQKLLPCGYREWLSKG